MEPRDLGASGGDGEVAKEFPAVAWRPAAGGMKEVGNQFRASCPLQRTDPMMSHVDAACCLPRSQLLSFSAANAEESFRM